MSDETDAKMEGAQDPGLEPVPVVPAADVQGHPPALLRGCDHIWGPVSKLAQICTLCGGERSIFMLSHW